MINMSKHVWIHIGPRQEPLSHIGPRLRLGTDIISRALDEGRYESRRALTYKYRSLVLTAATMTALF